jgi:hypothetical protein
MGMAILASTTTQSSTVSLLKRRIYRLTPDIRDFFRLPTHVDRLRTILFLSNMNGTGNIWALPLERTDPLKRKWA